MEWLVEFGPRQALLERMAESGKMPPSLAARPTLTARAGPFWLAYQRLTGSRNMNGTIPLSEIVQYANEYGFSSSSHRQDLVRFVGACDAAYSAVKERLRGAGVGS